MSKAEVAMAQVVRQMHVVVARPRFPSAASNTLNKNQSQHQNT
jgi:hypothetical protein